MGISKVATPRFFLVLSVAIYVSAFLSTYEYWVVPSWGYLGLSFREVPSGYLFISWVLCVIPALWLPCDVSRPSALLFLIQYLVIFVPTSFILYHSGLPEFPPGEALKIILYLFCGLSILQCAYRVRLVRIDRYRRFSSSFWQIFWLLMLNLFIYLVMVFGTHFRLANFEEIYEVRSQFDEIVSASGSPFAAYAQIWLAGFFLPFLFASGLFFRRWVLLVIVGAGYFYLFGIIGSKSTALAIIYIPAIYMWIRRGGQNAAAKFAAALAILLILPAPLGFLETSGETLKAWYIAVVHVRTFSFPQLSIGQYYDFFKEHPLTYGSHLNGVNLFVDYPYEMDIPRTVGWAVYNCALTQNVGMWGADGIASFGLIGIPIVSLMCAVVFWLFDSIARIHDVRFVIVALGNIALNFANTSLFTTLVSGGMLLLFFALYFFPQSATFHGGPILSSHRSPREHSRALGSKG